MSFSSAFAGRKRGLHLPKYGMYCPAKDSPARYVCDQNWVLQCERVQAHVDTSQLGEYLIEVLHELYQMLRALCVRRVWRMIDHIAVRTHLIQLVQVPVCGNKRKSCPWWLID